MDNLGFFPIICQTVFGAVLAYVTVCREQEVAFSCPDLEDFVFPYVYRTGEEIGLTTEQVHERKW